MSDVDGLPPLNAQEQKLVEAVFNGADNCEAYRAAYGAAGYSQNALQVRACQKIGQPHIQAHLRALRRIGINNAVIKLEARIKDELAFAQRCEDAENWGAAGNARDRVNKLLGLYQDRVEITHRDPVDALKELAAVAPELAAQLAKDAGIDWGTEH